MDSKEKSPKCQNDNFIIIEDKNNDKDKLIYKLIRSNPYCDFGFPLESFEPFKKISRLEN